MSNVSEFLKKHRNFLTYTVFGFLASIVNVVTFGYFHNTLKESLLIANTIAWFLSNLFSFVVNKHIVFKTNAHDFVSTFVELLKFFATRIISLIIDNIFMSIGLHLFPHDSIAVKIVDQVFVGILNYLVTSKIFLHDNSHMINKKDR